MHVAITIRNQLHAGGLWFGPGILMFPTSLRKSILNQFKKSSHFMRNRSFLSNLKSYTGPTRKEKDTIGEIEVPSSCLWGAQTQRYIQNVNLC